MKKEVEPFQTLDHKKLYEQFCRAVMARFKCIKEMPKIPLHYSTFIVSLSALKIGKRNIHGMAIKFCTYTDGKGTKEIIFMNGADAVVIDTFEQLVREIEKMKKKFKYEHISLCVRNELCLKDIREK